MEPIILSFLNNHPAAHTKNALTQHSKNWKEKQSGVFRTKFSDDRLFAILLCNNIDQESIKLAAAQQFDCSGRCCCYTPAVIRRRHPSHLISLLLLLFLLFLLQSAVFPTNSDTFSMHHFFLPYRNTAWSDQRQPLQQKYVGAYFYSVRKIGWIFHVLQIVASASREIRRHGWWMDALLELRPFPPRSLPLPLSTSLSFLFQIDRSTKLKIHFWNSFFSVC